MFPKMTLEQFNQIKSQLSKLVKDYDDFYDAHKDDPGFDDSALEEQTINDYIALQNTLLSYDLSDIPFEAWEGMSIVADESRPIDFSNTKANIDFALVEYTGHGNFHGCNVRNLSKLGRKLNVKDFDEETIKANASLFLSDSFSEEFKAKYYQGMLTISDFASLTSKQLSEVAAKGLNSHINYHNNEVQLIGILGLKKAVELYLLSKEEYEAINTIIYMEGGIDYRFNSSSISYDELKEQIKACPVTEIKSRCFAFARQKIINSSRRINVDLYPDIFIKENADIFLLNVNIPDDVKQRYFEHDLTIQDIITYADAFASIPIDYFLNYNSSYVATFARDNYGLGEFQKLVQRHADVFTHIADANDFYSLSQFLMKDKDLETSFVKAVKEYLFVSSTPSLDTLNSMDWLKSMNFTFVNKIDTWEELSQYNDHTCIIDKEQRMIVDNFGIENIRLFEAETGFFTHKDYEWSQELEALSPLGYHYSNGHLTAFKKYGINFQRGHLSYEEFANMFAKFIGYIRNEGSNIKPVNYDWIRGSFRDKHPDMFMDLNAPEELRKAFYSNSLSPKLLYNHYDYIPFLVNRNLAQTIKADMKLVITDSEKEETLNFIEEYTKRYGNEKFLSLCVKYGDVLSDLTITIAKNELDDENKIESAIKKSVYNKIVSGKVEYAYLTQVPEFVYAYPELFINLSSLVNIPSNERMRLTNAFYNRNMTFDDIKKHPELMTILKDKNLWVAFGNRNDPSNNTYNLSTGNLILLNAFDNDSFLKLCAEYGRYMDSILQLLNGEITIKDGKCFDTNTQNELTIEAIAKRIENLIIRESINGNLDYQPEDAPGFLSRRHPELFLSNDAPEELKLFFYNCGNNYPMSFDVLQKHKEWLPFLEGKALISSLLRCNYLKQDLIDFINLFGEEKALKLGISRSETVMEMMKAHNVATMKKWYDKTGRKFIPDFVVMQNFPLEDADKFLTSASNWSNLMRIKSFASSKEAREAMLKLGYSFGAFDQDQKGFKKLQNLLTSLPRNLKPNCEHVINELCHIEEKIKSLAPGAEMPLDCQQYLKLKEALIAEGFSIDNDKELFSQIYHKKPDGTYVLTINTQSYPKSTDIIRSMLGVYPDVPVLSPNKAHQLFGGFELKYDPDFREFLLQNIDEILDNPEYISFIANIQKQFSEIKAINSNRVLTLDLAISFIQSNKYTSVNVGNEKVAEISAIAGYSQYDFNVLQQIYNYGKQRVFSSIPRISQNTKKVSGDYTYEILRLDDPLAMAIGTLTDCCQELNNCAEVCMEHSMVDKNGRVFVIRDSQGNIVAQSWVWRNKDVLCFDNIEIPDKAFTRADREHPELGRKGFTDEIFQIYKQAAQDLMAADEEVYKSLLEAGMITEEQYEGLRLGKITVGLGYNDIAESLKANSKVDTSIVSRPLSFSEPVKLSRGLYTNDSSTQYILEERDDRKAYSGETLSVHSDTFIEYTDETFTEKSLLTLEKLELVTKNNPNYLETNLGEYADTKHIVTELARNYGLNPNTARIVMNPNFAIIYDINGDKLKIADLLFNIKVDNGMQQMDIASQVIMQIRLALDQIAKDKDVDISSLDSQAQEMYAKAISLTDEMDIERGINNGR